MIIVFCESGGRKLLGKAREISDSLGSSLTAVCSKDSLPSSLISLGADEVITANARSVEDWSKVISYLIRNEKDVRFVLFPSNPEGEAIMGSTYALAFERVGSYLDGLENVTEGSGWKKLYPSDCILKTAPQMEKTSLWSVRLSAVSGPFQDSSRQGKTRYFEMSLESKSISPLINQKNFPDQFSSLTVLVGENYYQKTNLQEKLEKLAESYSGRVIKMTGRLETVYGPCLAIEVRSSKRELPQFYSDLYSISSSNDAPITQMAKLGVVTEDVDEVIDGLSNQDHV